MKLIRQIVLTVTWIELKSSHRLRLPLRAVTSSFAIRNQLHRAMHSWPISPMGQSLSHRLQAGVAGHPPLAAASYLPPARAVV
jgi:hypothetical protein